MSDKAVFFTGAGGFIGRYILAHYLEEEDCDLYLLEHGRFAWRLRDFLRTILPDVDQRNRARVIEGDITQPGLGIDAPTLEEMKDRVTHTVHLAALYNLSAPKDVSMRVNVEGTRNVLNFLGSLKGLERLGYMSTVAISGDYAGGVFTEEDFDKGQGFKNFYEESKFEAEKLVRERRDAIPTVIFRPTIAVGHSKTGAFEKVDGPYYALTMIARNLHFVGVRSGPTKCHIAPVDYIADAFYAIFEDEDTVGKVYCLGDSNPMTYDAFLDLACKRWGKVRTLIKMPAGVMRPLVRLPYFDTIMGVTYEAFQYSIHPIEYPMTNTTAALEKHGITCPPVASYIDVMIQYFREHLRDPKIRKGDWKRSTT